MIRQTHHCRGFDVFAISKGVLPAIVFLALAGRGLGALEVQFSTAEGYPASAAALEGTPAEHPAWHTTPDGFQVDGAAKQAIASVKGESATALLATPIPLAAGQTITITTEFQFAGLDPDMTLGENGIQGPGLGLGASSSALFQGVFTILLGRFSWSNGEYALQVNPGGNTAHFSAGDLGIEGQGKLSDRLRLVLELTKGGSAQEWSYQASLYNVTKDGPVGRITGESIASPQEFYDSPNLYLNLNRGNSAETGGPAAVTFFGIKVD